MDFLRPRTWEEAVALKAERPDATPIQGGTDVMVEINLGKGRPAALLDLGRIPELAGWSLEDGTVRLGAGVTYAQVIGELGGLLPGLAQASRTVGSAQIRNRATVAGNLGSASPAGDAHPPLLASGAVVEAESVRGTRFTGRLVEETTVGGLPAVVPEVTGRAWVTGMGQYLLDASDPFPAGFAL